MIWSNKTSIYSLAAKPLIFRFPPEGAHKLAETALTIPGVWNAFRLANGAQKAELATELLELRKEQFNLRMQNSTGQMTNSSRFKVIRREIARIKTQMNDINRAEA